MDIHNVNSSSNLPPDRLRSEARDKVHQGEESSTPQNDPDGTPTPQDRVEISDAGQMASTDLSPEAVIKLREARRALHDLPSLSADRAAELAERVQNGYYSDAQQIRRTARGIAHELMGQPPENPGAGE